ncbi:MAG: hypothetical protein HOP04_01975 [Methylophilaceae bacterium]|nr:hypothetical protein [Methylophilaceae bacterium]
MASVKSENLLFSFRTDTANSVSRTTVKNLVGFLGFTTETQVIHYALSKLAKEVLPAYEPDDGDLTSAQMQAIHKAVPQGKLKSVKSSIF